jgi:Sulfotransferase family
VAASSSSGNGLPAPFVVGVGRSGTTLLRLMLDAHPDLAIPPETPFLPELIDAARDPRATPESLVAVIASHRRAPDFEELGWDVLKGRFATVDPIEPSGILRGFYGAYAESRSKPRWGDKTPRHAARIEQLAEVLPEARFIHLIRDGRDVVLSRIESLALRPKTIDKVSRQWSNRVMKARRQGTRTGRYVEVRYEDLVVDPEPVLRRLCSFCELDFDPAMLQYYEHSGDRLAEIAHDLPPGKKRPGRAAESRLALHDRLTHPPDTTRVARWRSEMSAEDLEAFDREAGELLRELGYRD